MSDRELIKFLWTKLWTVLTKDDVPTEDELYQMKEELNARDIKTEF